MMKKVEAYERSDGKLFRSIEELHRDALDTSGPSIQRAVTRFKAATKAQFDYKYDRKPLDFAEIDAAMLELKEAMRRADAAIQHLRPKPEVRNTNPGAQLTRPPKERLG